MESNATQIKHFYNYGIPLELYTEYRFGKLLSTQSNYNNLTHQVKTLYRLPKHRLNSIKIYKILHTQREGMLNRLG